MRFRLALIGFGRVAQAFAKTLIEKRADLRCRFGFDYEVVAVADTIKGSVLSRKGFDFRGCSHLRKRRALSGTTVKAEKAFHLLK
jgi:homoserine dehydrogenase